MKSTTKKKPKQEAEIPAADQFSFNGREILRILLMVAFAIACWCYITGRTSVATWQVPLEYGIAGADGDAQGVLSHLKAASEGEFIPFFPKNTTRLGAPYYSSLSDIPIIEEFQFWIPGLLSKFIGLFAAVNLAVLVAQMLACVCFYIAARMLDCKWWWAFAGAISFGFAEFAFARSVHHLMVTNYWYIPFCLLIAGWMTRNEMGEIGGRRYRLTLLASFLIGMQNPYYTNMFLQFVLLGAFYQYFRQGWKPVIQAGGIVGASAAGFCLMNVDTWIYRFGHGANPAALVRDYRWLELSALKFVDLLIPPQDHSLLGWIGRAYFGTAGKEYDPGVAKLVAFPSEVPPSCYLGLLGIGCLIWLAVVSVRRLVLQPGRNLPVEAWQTLWILAYAAVGGLNCLAGILGVTLFRSTTRYCIFILPILLLFAAKRLSKKNIDPALGVLAAAGCALIALWDQTPQVATPSSISQMAQVIDSDRTFTRQIESKLPKAAMVFQIPIMEFPEAPAPGMPSYDHIRPYLHSDALRFSFGGIKGRPWVKWQQGLAQRPFPEIIRAVEAYGFSAVYVNRNGFQDRGAGILDGFKQLGYTDVIESKLGDLFCVMIHPDPRPILPAGVVN